MGCAKDWTLNAVMSPNLQQFSLQYQLNQVTKSIGVVFVQSYGKKNIDRDNKITAETARTILLEHFKFTEVMVLTDFSKAQMLEKFYDLKRHANAFEQTKNNMPEHIKHLTSLEAEAKKCEDPKELEKLESKISSLKDKIDEHRGVFGLGFFALGLAFNPAHNRY